MGEKKTVAGRLAAGSVVAKRRKNIAPRSAQRLGKPLRPSQYEKYLRKTVAEAFPEIVDGFVTEAKRGGCQYVKMATEILKPQAARASRSRTKGPAELLMEKYGGEFGYLPEDHPLRTGDRDPQ